MNFLPCDWGNAAIDKYEQHYDEWHCELFVLIYWYICTIFSFCCAMWGLHAWVFMWSNKLGTCASGATLARDFGLCVRHIVHSKVSNSRVNKEASMFRTFSRHIAICAFCCSLLLSLPLPHSPLLLLHSCPFWRAPKELTVVLANEVHACMTLRLTNSSIQSDEFIYDRIWITVEFRVAAARIFLPQSFGFIFHMKTFMHLWLFSSNESTH